MSSRYTLTWHTHAIDDLIQLAHALEAHTIKAVQDNIPLLLGDPRPINARPLAGILDGWELPVATVIVEYQIIANSVIRILGIRSRP